ncbi:hypothetical protein RI129_013171 [Pyrocoelia pectoralis]|uniref:Uncharacterized protein n=1 Tax=Pyrocoelia pectoralis TaxID=417401 RepID=A0AAN7V4F2_9COLE
MKNYVLVLCLVIYVTLCNSSGQNTPLNPGTLFKKVMDCVNTNINSLDADQREIYADAIFEITNATNVANETARCSSNITRPPLAPDLADAGRCIGGTILERPNLVETTLYTTWLTTATTFATTVPALESCAKLP